LLLFSSYHHYHHHHFVILEQTLNSYGHEVEDISVHEPDSDICMAEAEITHSDSDSSVNKQA
jgi:hypothetical protein